MTKRHLAAAVVMAVINLASIVAGFWAFHLVGGDSQILVQVPVALVTGVGGVCLGCVGLARVHRLEPGPDYVVVMLLAFPAGALIFTGIHYLLAGYLTSFGNILGIWSIQLAENTLGLAMAGATLRSRRAASLGQR